jgi:hypothetical protein
VCVQFYTVCVQFYNVCVQIHPNKKLSPVSVNGRAKTGFCTDVDRYREKLFVGMNLYTHNVKLYTHSVKLYAHTQFSP